MEQPVVKVKLICTASAYPQYQTVGKVYDAEYNEGIGYFLITNDVGKQHYVPLEGSLFKFDIVEEGGECDRI